MRGRTSRQPASRMASMGFTLVEAIVLLSVVGIIAAVSAPRFLAMSDMNAIQAHRQAIGDLRYAQRRAASSGCPVQVDFSASGYTLNQRTDCRTGAFSVDLRDPATGSTPFQVSLPAGVTLTSSLDPLVFDVLGRSTNATGTAADANIFVGSRRVATVGESGLVHVP